MTRILTVALHELRRAARSGELIWLTGLALVILGTAMVAGSREVREAAREQASAQAIDRAVWDGQADKNPHSAAHFGMWIFRPPAPLSVVDPGLTPHVGRALYLEAHARHMPVHRAAEVTRLPGEGSRLTVAFVLELLLPFLLIVLLYGVGTQEREGGTLPLLLTAGLSPRQLVFGKLLGRIGPLLALLAIGGVVGAAWLIQSPEAGGSWPRILLMMVVHGAHLAIVAAVVTLVSLRAPNTRSALAVLLLGWLTVGWIVPRVTIDVAHQLEPTPGPTAFAEAVERSLDSLPAWNDRVDAVTQRLMEENGVTDPLDLPRHPDGWVLTEAEGDEANVYARHHAALSGIHASQENLWMLGGLVAPLIPVRSLSTALAGTDRASLEHFDLAAEDYRLTTVQDLNALLVERMPAAGEYSEGREVWESVPAFDYTPPSVASLWPRMAPSAGLLLLWLLGTWGLLWLEIPRRVGRVSG